MSKLSAVIIDDDSVLRSLTSAILRNADIEIAGEASQADTGLKLCLGCKPDLVLLDINLPNDASGIDLLPEILLIDPAPKVIMITGDATLDRVRTSLQLGAAGFVVKPFTPAKLLDAVGRSLGLI
jgi:DNA-binding NarL/FixJ family response regulator